MRRRADTERPTLDLMEEAVHLLRTTRMHLFGWYLVGVLPFLLGLLYFWMDMASNAVAFQHRAEASGLMALLFLWMKAAQAVFAGNLRASLARESLERLTLRRFLRIALFQSIIQPTKLFLLPAAALATIPLGWVWAFYENATALQDDETVRKLIGKSWRQAALWPRQNHCALCIYVLLFTVVFVNVAMLVFMVPSLVKMLGGIETIFTRSPMSMFNSTFFALVAVLTYVVCDPLLKAVYALRCFYGESLRSGADLAAELRALLRTGAAAAMLIASCVLSGSTAVAAPFSNEPPLAARATELNDAIEKTVARPEFSWKLPRQREVAQPRSKWPFVDAIGRFIQATGRLVKRALKAIGRWADKLFQQRTPLPDSAPSASVWQTSSRTLMISLLIVLAAAALALIAQTVKQLRLRRSAPMPPETTTQKLDLEDEHLTADLLPEEEWLALARSHLARGELRFALRAFFLAGLAHLAAREILVLARFKSNRDYHAELRRRASDRSAVIEAFAQNITLVERVWYGHHEIDADALQRFETNLEQIRAC